MGHHFYSLHIFEIENNNIYIKTKVVSDPIRKIRKNKNQGQHYNFAQGNDSKRIY